MKETMKENKGYSLVEMIIVIAIIAVMSAGAMVTVTLINSAKSKEAGVNFDSEVSELIAKSKSQIPKFQLDGEATASEHSDYYFAMAVFKDGDKYYMASGYYSKTDGFHTYDADNNNDGRGQSITSRVSVNYVAGSKNNGTMTANVRIGGTEEEKTGAWVIAFDKSGRCVSGVGTYEFSKASDNIVLDTVTINANGSHQSK
jgi:prepilin-type N-terminal cleavage/methylation domain-containing protein